MGRDLPSPRRSRRANGSSSASKSPDTAEPEPEYSSRSKRMKHEDDPDDETAIPQPSRARRKKEKDTQELVEPVLNDGDPDDPALEDEEQGVTRCICEEENDPGEFMVQCEKCGVWQHGLCMGFRAESEIWDVYFCEECKPELHSKTILNWQAKRRERPGRHSSAGHQVNGHTRPSRSHSPTIKQNSKRRNTMNSRDYDFDELTRQAIAASAAEAQARDSFLPLTNGHVNGQKEVGEDQDINPATGRKKRRRTDEESQPKKRTRSVSTASENPLSAQVASGETPSMPPPSSKAPVPVIGPPPKGGRGKRGGNRKNVTNIPPNDTLPTPEAEEGAQPIPPPSKRGGGTGRGRGGYRKPQNAHSHQSHENTTRSRGANANSNAPGGDSSKHSRNSHAYVVSQQPLLTSWGLPDYLAHLEQLLPSESPIPLEVPCGGENGGTSAERGVKVKWPSKRMSVVDMNKRVRALVEWVGREQASAMDRGRRKGALENAIIIEQQQRTEAPNGHNHMLVDGSTPPPRIPPLEPEQSSSRSIDLSESTGTMKLMEELMDELIRFQERFGPGRNRERDKGRIVS